MIPGVRDMPGGHHQGWGGGAEFESGAIFCNSRWRPRWPPAYSHT